MLTVIPGDKRLPNKAICNRIFPLLFKVHLHDIHFEYSTPKFCTRANNIGHGLLEFGRVKVN